MHDDPAVERAKRAHRLRWGEPDFVVRAPGRVNLIGEHTDYNDGFTLPMALPFDTALAVSSSGDAAAGSVTISSDGFGEVKIDPTADPRSVDAWATYISGSIGLLAEHGIPTGGWRASVETDIPTGASLSSSAAIEVATITAMLHRAGTSWAPVDVAQLGQRVENEVVGVPSGIMDQFISAGAVDGHAGLMDCRSLTLTPTRIPDDVVVAIMDSGTRRKLAEAAYGDRRASCQRAAESLGVAALRDATPEQVATIADATDRRRARHIVTENRRTLGAVDALAAGDTAEFGRLMRASHASLRDDFEVSGPGLDAIVEAADRAPGCLGARMTGGGFAGCAVALVDVSRTEEFGRFVLDEYSYDGHTADIWICAPAAGASLVDP